VQIGRRHYRDGVVRPIRDRHLPLDLPASGDEDGREALEAPAEERDGVRCRTVPCAQHDGEQTAAVACGGADKTVTGGPGIAGLDAVGAGKAVVEDRLRLGDDARVLHPDRALDLADRRSDGIDEAGILHRCPCDHRQVVGRRVVVRIG